LWGAIPAAIIAAFSAMAAWVMLRVTGVNTQPEIPKK